MLKKRLLFPWLVLSSLAAMGCGGPDFDAICDQQESCAGGNDKDREACVAAFEGFSDVADDIGCADEFDAYYACTEEHAACRDTPTGDACMADNDCNGGGGGGEARCTAGICVIKDYGFDPNAQDNPCEAEQNAYSRCF